MPAETNDSTVKAKRPTRPRFWVGPLVAGACFALGYGITQRFVLIRSGLKQAEPQSFKARAFPGESLEALRLRYGQSGSLEADVAAKELIDAKASKQAKALEKEKLAKEKLAKMLREAYNLGATAHEESMTIEGRRYGEIEVHVEISEGGFRYYGDANVDSDVITDCISFDDHNMTDEQVDEILNS